MKKPSITPNDPPTNGQKESCVALITDATRKAAGVAFDDLVKKGVLTRKNVEQVRARGKEVAAAVTATVKENFAELAKSGYVEFISEPGTLTLDPADGKRTIARATSVFTGYIDPGFKAVDKSGSATGAVTTAVYEQVEDGTFAQIFGAFGRPLDDLYFSQDQIIQFVEKYPHWLHRLGSGTLFLFEFKRKFFVANVHKGGVLTARIFRFKYGRVWKAGNRPRVVVPQLVT